MADLLQILHGFINFNKNNIQLRLTWKDVNLLKV
jgi:hypothetical protein